MCDIVGCNQQGLRSTGILIGCSVYSASQGDPPVTLLILEGVTQGYPLLMVLYVITPIPLAEELQAEDLGLLTMFCAEDSEIDGLAWSSAQLLNISMKRGPNRGYYLNPSKSMFIMDFPW